MFKLFFALLAGIGAASIACIFTGSNLIIGLVGGLVIMAVLFKMK